jgi:type II secretory ATPase GspE/PulE/Tfp pilus assembly ATPase PilB-like protein
MAVDAAYTGHLVLSSFHASSAYLAPLRLVEMGIAPALVGAGLSGILAQRLVRRLCSSCRVPDEAAYELEWPDGRPETLWAANPRGCQRCATAGRGGYRGRVAVGELLVVDDAARRAIVAGADPATLRQVMLAQGGSTMWADGLAKVAAGVTSMAELARALKKEEAE